MKEVQKSSDLGTFLKLTKKRQKAIVITDRAIYKWKKDPAFIQAQNEYAIHVLNSALPDSIRELMKLVQNSKSDMVKLQAIQTVLKHANLLSDNSTPELDRAKIRKANADARVAEAKAKAMEDNGADVELLLDKMMDTLAKEDLKHGSK